MSWLGSNMPYSVEREYERGIEKLTAMEINHGEALFKEQKNHILWREHISDCNEELKLLKEHGSSKDYEKYKQKSIEEINKYHCIVDKEIEQFLEEIKKKAKTMAKHAE